MEYYPSHNKRNKRSEDFIEVDLFQHIMDGEEEIPSEPARSSYNYLFEESRQNVEYDEDGDEEEEEEDQMSLPTSPYNNNNGQNSNINSLGEYPDLLGTFDMGDVLLLPPVDMTTSMDSSQHGSLSFSSSSRSSNSSSSSSLSNNNNNHSSLQRQGGNQYPMMNLSVKVAVGQDQQNNYNSSSNSSSSNNSSSNNSKATGLKSRGRGRPGRKKNNWKVWSVKEQELFISAYNRHGRDWKKIHDLFPDKTLQQVRTHAYGMFRKLQQQGVEDGEEDEQMEVLYGLI